MRYVKDNNNPYNPERVELTTRKFSLKEFNILHNSCLVNFIFIRELILLVKTKDDCNFLPLL